ncbi:MAG: phosphatidylserine decarboxylase family protein [Deltaproteobacteria bacterium]|nr:phosphatidylserine decarboxylase family protein [Deltaproteobacteria bacterium]MBW1995995.1 phosphatidylserine decarboxylase family protein [Deltaproteobacteria bacterium]MBW2150936.1 phosphatidylserine decarboxylase family protein [Deltaproteobacteria bacterium]
MRHFGLPLAKAGYPFIAAGWFLTVLFFWLAWVLPAIGAFLATLFICYFFRDPERTVPNHQRAVVAPADGRIIEAGRVENGPLHDKTCIKISIFMSVFNVHVNRIPCDGKITHIEYRPGRFFSAYLEKASKRNEQNFISLETTDGIRLCFVQIAGLIARRILCSIKVGDSVARGERFGMICFGSRVDVYLPMDIDVNVSVGSRVKAGTSILGYLR